MASMKAYFSRDLKAEEEAEKLKEERAAAKHAIAEEERNFQAFMSRDHSPLPEGCVALVFIQYLSISPEEVRILEKVFSHLGATSYSSIKRKSVHVAHLACISFAHCYHFTRHVPVLLTILFYPIGITMEEWIKMVPFKRALIEQVYECAHNPDFAGALEIDDMEAERKKKANDAGTKRKEQYLKRKALQAQAENDGND